MSAKGGPATGEPTNRRRVQVRWVGHGKVFEGVARDTAKAILDGDSTEGPSPTEALLMSLAACMGIDIGAILEKGRVPIDALTLAIEGDRAPEPPRRFTAIRIAVNVKGPTEADRPKLERAIQLSHDKYCSVFHTLRSDLEVEITSSIG